MCVGELSFERAVLVPAVGLRPLELQTVLAARLPARQTNSFVRLLSSALPAPELKHFKRVRRSSSDGSVEVLLCKSSGTSDAAACKPSFLSDENGGLTAAAGGGNMGDAEQEPACSGQQAASCTTGTEHAACVAELPPDLAEEIHRHGAELRKVLVPANPPQIRQQWEQWSAQFWPMAWRAPDAKVQAAAERVEATPDEQAYFESHMVHVLRACSPAASGMSGSACSSLPCNAARIVAPSTNLVVGQGMDSRHLHPLQHATMRALAAASAWEREQWPAAEDGSCFHQPSTTGRESRAGSEGGPSGAEGGVDTQGAVAHQQQALGLQGAGCQQGSCSACDAGGPDTVAAPAARTSGCQGSTGVDCEGGVAHKRQRTDHDHHCHQPQDDSQHHHEQGSTRQPPDGPNSSHHQASPAQQQGAQVHHLPGSHAGPAPARPSTAQALGMSKPYLCTGYDCFIAKEPCVMCAMALVHSRVARVIMCHSDPGGGALGGKLQLMGHASLNHHYKVYKMGLES